MIDEVGILRRDVARQIIATIIEVLQKGVESSDIEQDATGWQPAAPVGGGRG
jgi:hypothetical protein